MSLELYFQELFLFHFQNLLQIIKGIFHIYFII
nr:MAG TPA: hypothetical protein [Caudoviricetes sp.]